MKMHYSRKTRQLKRLVLNLKTAQELNFHNHIKGLKIKIKSLYSQLIRTFSKQQLHTILGSATFIIAVSTCSNNLQAQDFAPPIQNPFSLNPALGYFGGLSLADLDDDGDLDIFQGYVQFNQDSARIEYFENTGTLTNPIFGNSQTNPFGLIDTYLASLPTFVDLDNDGDLDLLVGEAYGTFKYFQNTGTSNSPEFLVPLSNPFGLSSTYLFVAPTVADIDNDGDFDLMVGEAYGNLVFFENIGTATAPSFSAPIQNPFGLNPVVGGTSVPSFVDIDSDGDFDLLVGEYEGNNHYFENIGTAELPNFNTAVLNPFDLIPVFKFSSPAFGDLDSDGDLDLLVNEYYENMQYFENVQNSATLLEIEQNSSFYPNPFHKELAIRSNIKIDRLDIYSINGALIKSILNPNSNINLEELEPGMYIMTAFSDNEAVATERIEKE
jgi:hypothetical protein